jgi:hypothetical protein
LAASRHSLNKELEMTHSNGNAPDGMRQGDRDTIATLIRRQEKVAKSDARRLATERLAQVEGALSREFEAEDQRWAAMIEKANVTVAAANDEIRRICIAEGVPETFAPRLSLRWLDRGENMDPRRRGELRLAARARIAAMEATARAEIERRSVAAQTALLAGGLTSDAARQALADMPTAEALLPEVSVEELRLLAERDYQKRQADHEVSVAGTMALLSGYRES